VKKISTVQVFGNEIFKKQKLTIGVDLGDRWSFSVFLNKSGKIILEQKLSTTAEAMKQTFTRIPRSRIALETGTHSPWASRLLTQLGHEVIVAQRGIEHGIARGSGERSGEGIRNDRCPNLYRFVNTCNRTLSK
jgi:hypothetical protein